ncbi:MAG: hypothetical protein LBC09_07510 [Helicobacteraceae bacterium]|jgi:hypothetical protein|nr:hypothetical protein [Helicobacteraceae bacterium]
MKYLIIVSLSLLSLSAIDAPQKKADLLIEKAAPSGEETQKRGERFLELYGGDTNSRYINYLKNMERLEGEYYRRVRSAKETFYKRMQEI